MELEEARDILANCIDDYVISSYCNNTCDEEVDCKNEDCIFHQAIEVVLNHLTKQEKTLDYLIKNYFAIDDICPYVEETEYCKKEECVKCIKQYFENKAEESE